MQNEMTTFFNDIMPQSLGMTDPTPLFGLCLALPGLLMFIFLFFGRELLRPRWRGYWDAV